MTLPPDQMKPVAPLPTPDPKRWSAKGPVWVGMLSVVVLVGALLIGWIAGADGVASVCRICRSVLFAGQ